MQISVIQPAIIFDEEVYSHGTFVSASVYIGNEMAAQDIKWLKNEGINTIISCSGDNINNNFISHKINFSLDDEKNFNEQIDDIVKLMYMHTSKHGNLLVYCKNGDKLSTLVVACYLIYANFWTKEKAINFIKKKLYNSLDYLVAYEDKVKHYEKYQLGGLSD